jgi:hypothetical protein
LSIYFITQKIICCQRKVFIFKFKSYIQNSSQIKKRSNISIYHVYTKSFYFISIFFQKKPNSFHSSIQMNTTDTSSESLDFSIRPHLILLDILLIISIFLGFFFCLSFICISVGYRSCHSILTLLSANSCIAGFIFNSVQLSNALLLFRDDIHRSTSNLNQYCEIRNYLMHVSGSLLYYSYCIQSISRLFFVVLYKHKVLLTYHIHFILIAIQWTLGLILPISMISSGHRQYQTDTSQCFITIKNVSQTLYGKRKQIYQEIFLLEFRLRYDFNVCFTNDNYFNMLYTYCLFRTSCCCTC